MRRTVLLVVVLVLSACDSTPAATPPPRAASPSHSGTPVIAQAMTVRMKNAARRDWVRKVVSRASDRWPAPESAQRVRADRLGFLHRQRVEADDGGPVLRRSRLWLVPGEARAVMLRIVRHPAPGWGIGPRFSADTWMGIDTHFGRGPRPVYHRYLGPGPDRGGLYREPRAYFSASVQTMQLGDEVAVRVDVSGVPVPARPDRSYLSGVDSVTFTQFTGARLHHLVFKHELRGRGARRLARDFNSMPAWTQVGPSCPFQVQTRYVLDFHTADGDLKAEGAGGCWTLWNLSRHGNRAGPQLAGTFQFGQVIRRLGIVTPDM